MTTETAALRGPLRKRESSLWAREADDWYVEPEWCSRRLFEEEKFEGEICDPAAGGGNIIRSAAAAGYDTAACDIVYRGFDLYNVGDFLTSGSRYDNYVTNPPFALAEAFLARALKNSHRKVALLLPANWVQGDKRSRMLAATPLRRVYFITPRPSMPPGHVLAAGDKPGNGTTDYAWFVWLRGYDGWPEVRWLRRNP
jgi:hypothetical protein